ncbi:hypothetical protein [Bradyrhizobium symbiodeficiens]|uniref:hypothetical protein n=1 Tax=Bradyrhizobium symbiodeficiens TaxID=1404367 RepID=UPI00140FA29A|nr:hypothetical protein [Bradyrhizobium symbiodeficiens]QIO98794.1 hypothetical protein HAU86_02750 [Bradyrhizobium symbiodeficiens]
MNLLLTIPRFGTALLLSGLVLLLWPNLTLFLAVAFCGLIIGLATLYAAIDDRKALRISWVLSTSLLFAYDGGSVSTYLSAPSAPEFAIMVKDRPIELISSTLALVNIICGLLLIAGQLESPVVTKTAEATEDSWFSFALATFGLILIVAAYLAGDLGYMGIQIDEAGRITVLGAAAALFQGPLAGIAGFMLARSRRRTMTVFYAAVVLMVVLAAVPTGRRPIVLILIVATMGFSLGGGLQRLSLSRKLLGVACGAAIAYVMSSYFFALRLAGWELGTDATLADQMSLGLEFLVSPSLQDRFTTLFYENVRERTFLLGYLADLMEAVSNSAPLYGEALLYYMRLCIPSALDPGKDQIIALQMVEALAHPKLGLPVIDQANTILTDGMTDFGVIGAGLYALVMLALLRGAIFLIQKFPAPITVMFGTFAIVHLALKPELTLDEYLVPLRNLAVIVPLMWFIETMTGMAFSRRLAHQRDEQRHPVI